MDLDQFNLTKLGKVQKRIVEAIQLHRDGQGLDHYEIAERLGKSVAMIDRYLRAHPCADCQRPVASAAQLCKSCGRAAGYSDPHPWTRPECIAAAHRWVAEEGKPPASADWCPTGHPRWQPGVYPTSTAVCKGSARLWDSWSEFLADVNPSYARQKPRAWTDEEILEQLRDFYRRNGVAPTTGTWDGSPDVLTIAHRFHGWPNAIAAAGIPPARVKKLWDSYSEEQLKALYCELARELGHPPHGNTRVGRDGRFPSPAYMTYRFNCSHNDVLRLCGLYVKQNAPWKDPETIPVAILGYFHQHGQWPSSTTWRRLRLRPSLSVIFRKGGWEANLQKAKELLELEQQQQAA